MKSQRICKTCGESFEAIKETQLFCKRKCFRKDYYHRKRKEDQDRKLNPVYPIFNCQNCGNSSSLMFDPIEDIARFNNFVCPYCRYNPREEWENRNMVIRKISLEYISTKVYATTGGPFCDKEEQKEALRSSILSLLFH